MGVRGREVDNKHAINEYFEGRSIGTERFGVTCLGRHGHG
jgi:hypothetical protein